jgi:hypothetical protein
MFSCLPFLCKPTANLQKTKSEPVKPEAVKPEPVKPKVDEDPGPFVEVPQILRIRLPLRIPDALMDIRNPTTKAQFKDFCKNNNLCVACSYSNPKKPTVLVFNGVLYECPHCDSDVDSP